MNHPIYLKHISGNEFLAIAPSDGRETIAGATKVFHYIDSNFSRWGCEAPAPPTGTTLVELYEMARDGTFKELFSDLGVNIGRLAFTQAQILQFVQCHSPWLKRGGNGTFFLFKADGDFLVATVYFFADGRLGTRLRRFSLERVFRAAKRHRLVVPQFF